MERETASGHSCGGHGKTAVIFGISPDMAFALANVLLGLRRHSPKLLRDVIVYHDGLSDPDKNALCAIAPCQFIEYSPVFPGGKPSFHAEHINAYTLNMFARYEGFRLLDEYDAVIWFDVDILITRDVTILLDIVAKSGEGIGMCLENRDWFKFGDNFVKPVPGYDMDSPMFNSGLLVLTRDLKNAREIHAWLYEATAEYAGHLRWPDQGILNMMLKKFQIIPACFAYDMYNRNPASDNDGLATMLHSYGPKKFWNHPEYYAKYPQWQKNHREWSMIRRRHQPQDFHPAVSVVIPLFNCRRFVYWAMRSVLEQTFVDMEAIVVNNGSTDDSLRIVEKFRDPRIRIINNPENRGISSSLNRGIQEARGEYIARMDADDYAMPFRLAAQVKYLSGRPEISLCATSVSAFGDADWQTHNVDDDELLRCNLLVANPFVHPSVMFRKNDFDEFGLKYDPSYDGNEDLELWQRASGHVKFGYIDVPLLMYRRHDSSVTSPRNGGKTQKLTMSLVQRAFSSSFNATFSRNALLLLTQSGNMAILSPSEAVNGFREICEKFIDVTKKPAIYDKKKLALTLLRHLRWMYAESKCKHPVGGFGFRHAAAVLAIRAGIVLQAMKTIAVMGFSVRRISRHARVLATSPRVFMRNVRRRILMWWIET